MNIVTDTITQIQSMKFRKVLSLLTNIALALRVWLRNDSLFSPNDLEISNAYYKHREPSSRSAQVYPSLLISLSVEAWSPHTSEEIFFS